MRNLQCRFCPVEYRVIANFPMKIVSKLRQFLAIDYRFWLGFPREWIDDPGNHPKMRVNNPFIEQPQSQPSKIKDETSSDWDQ